MGGAGLAYGVANPAKLVGAGFRGVAQGVFDDRLCGQVRAIGPHHGREVQVRPQAGPGCVEAKGDGAPGGHRQAVASHGQHGVLSEVIFKPCQVLRRMRSALAHQFHARPGQFLLRLGEVPRVGPHARVVGGHH